MTSTQSRSYTRVAVIAPSTRVDLALPVDVPIIDLLPVLLDYTGEVSDDGGGTHGGWQLTRGTQGELDTGRTLRSLDVADGEVLRLSPREEPSLPPLFDDIVDAVAQAARSRINTRSANPGIGAAAIVGALVLGAVTLLSRGQHTVDAYVAGAIAVVVLGIATAIAKGASSYIVACATAAAGLPYALVVGLLAVPDHHAHFGGHWGLLLGCALVLGYALAAVLALGTGAVVFSAAATASLIGALAALVAGLAHEPAIHIVAGTCAVTLALLVFLPRVAIRLARLPLGTVPTTGAELAETDDIGDIGEITAAARLAGEYLLGTLIGCAVVLALTAGLLGAHREWKSLALAGCVVAAMAMRARMQPALGARIALLSAALVASAAAVVIPLVLSLVGHHRGLGHRGHVGAVLVIELAVALLALTLTAFLPRVHVSPQARRLVDLLESLLMIAVLPLAAAVIDLYSTLRHL